MPALLSIIIPTYNRSEPLFRTLRFLQSQSLRLPIIVADGSDDSIAQTNAGCTQLGANISYVHSPAASNESPWQNYRRRISTALNRVTTSYTVYCADDDLLIIENAMTSAQFLQEHADYIGCHGSYLHYRYQDARLSVTNVAYAGASIDGDEIPSRLIQLFSSYEAIFYAVFRTQAKRVLLDRYSEVEQPLWPEIYHATGAVIDGKIKRLEDNIFTLRNVGLAPHPQKMDNFGQWVVFDFANFLISYQKFRDRVTEWAHDCGGLRIDHIGLRRAIDMAFMIYIGREFDPIFWIGEYLANSIVDEEEKNRLRLRLEAEFRVGKSDDTYMVNLDKRSPTAKKEALKFLVTSFLGQGSFRIFQKLRDSLLLRQNNLMSSKAVLHDEIEINPSLKAKFSENQWGLLRKIHFSI